MQNEDNYRHKNAQFPEQVAMNSSHYHVYIVEGSQGYIQLCRQRTMSGGVGREQSFQRRREGAGYPDYRALRASGRHLRRRQRLCSLNDLHQITMKQTSVSGTARPPMALSYLILSFNLQLQPNSLFILDKVVKDQNPSGFYYYLNLPPR